MLLWLYFIILIFTSLNILIYCFLTWQLETLIISILHNLKFFFDKYNTIEFEKGFFLNDFS
jgi:hypothetical protein